jgi:hypothetical protein
LPLVWLPKDDDQKKSPEYVTLNKKDVDVYCIYYSIGGNGYTALTQNIAFVGQIP